MTSQLPAQLRSHPIKQVALVVRDIEASMRAYAGLFGMVPWTGYTLSRTY